MAKNDAPLEDQGTVNEPEDNEGMGACPAEGCEGTVDNGVCDTCGTDWADLAEINAPSEDDDPDEAPEDVEPEAVVTIPTVVATSDPEPEVVDYSKPEDFVNRSTKEFEIVFFCIECGREMGPVEGAEFEPAACSGCGGPASWGPRNSIKAAVNENRAQRGLPPLFKGVN